MAKYTIKPNLSVTYSDKKKPNFDCGQADLTQATLADIEAWAILESEPFTIIVSPRLYGVRQTVWSKDGKESVEARA